MISQSCNAPLTNPLYLENLDNKIGILEGVVQNKTRILTFSK